MEIADAITSEAENIAEEEYKKEFINLEQDEQDICISIAESIVLGI
tara:strand:+ start:433 stop:570 length:138 start_codon:yes stop_codon:yes gene_type:complete